MERGYVKLWRKMGDSGLLAHPHALQVAIWCMIRCAWKPTKYATRNGIIDLAPGQVVISRRKLAAELSMSERNIRTAFLLLSKTGFCVIGTTHGTTHGWTIITLENWAKYQMDPKEATHQKSPKRPKPDPDPTQEEEVKEVISLQESINITAATPPALGFDPIAIAIEAIQAAGGVVLKREPKIMALLHGAAKKLGEQKYRDACAYYVKQDYYLKHGLSLKGLYGDLDKCANAAQATKPIYKPIREGEDVF